MNLERIVGSGALKMGINKKKFSKAGRVNIQCKTSWAETEVGKRGQVKGNLQDLILPFSAALLDRIMPRNLILYMLLAREDNDDCEYFYLQALTHIHICMMGLVTSSVICTE